MIVSGYAFSNCSLSSIFKISATSTVPTQVELCHYVEAQVEENSTSYFQENEGIFMAKLIVAAALVPVLVRPSIVESSKHSPSAKCNSVLTY